MLWVKALHIIAVVSWFAGLFYLPRLFVYHVQAEDKISQDRFKQMERRLYRGIMIPSFIATLVFGGWLLFLNWPYYKTAPWMHLKLTLVFLLAGYQGLCGAYVRRFQQNKNKHSHVYYRVFNELPFLFLVVIVILVVVKPL